MGAAGLLQEMRSACRPWESADASEPISVITKEEQDKIDFCLRCPLPECNNCLERKAKGAGRGRPKAADADELMLLVEMGMTAAEIAGLLGCSRSTVYAALQGVAENADGRGVRA